MKTLLTIEALGSPRILVDGEDIKSLLSQKAIGVIIYLALSKQKSMSRELLASYFWETNDLKTARYNLRHTLWKINQAITHIKLVETSRTTCQINPAIKVEIDADVLESYHQSKALHQLTDIAPVLKTYRGDFLDGEYYQNASVINEWVLNMRQYCQRLAFELLSHLGDGYLALGQFESSQKYYKELLRINSLHEETYLKLMENRLKANDRVAAINYYQKCARHLREELNIDPNELLQEKYEAILVTESKEQTNQILEREKTTLKQRTIYISGITFFDYEFLSRLVEQLLLYLELKMVTEKEQEVIYYLKPVYPTIIDYLLIENDQQLDVKNDIGIYYGVIMLIECICRTGNLRIEVQEYQQIDLPSKKLLSAIEIKMDMIAKGILFKN